jgi:hypothetical protein
MSIIVDDHYITHHIQIWSVMLSLIHDEQIILEKVKNITPTMYSKNMQLFSGVRPSIHLSVGLSVKQARFVSMGAIDPLLFEEVPWSNDLTEPKISTI